MGWGSGERRGGGCELGQRVDTWNTQKRYKAEWPLEDPHG